MRAWNFSEMLINYSASTQTHRYKHALSHTRRTRHRWLAPALWALNAGGLLVELGQDAIRDAKGVVCIGSGSLPVVFFVCTVDRGFAFLPPAADAWQHRVVDRNRQLLHPNTR